MHEEHLQGPMGGWGGSNTCVVRTLCPQHTSHRCRTLVQFTEVTTIGGNQRVAAGLLAVAAHGRASMQQGSVSCGKDQLVRDLCRADESTANFSHIKHEDG